MSETELYQMLFGYVTNNYNTQEVEIHLVWFCKTLQNSKAIYTIMKENKPLNFVEVTYNGDKKDVYIDVYNKIINKAIHIEGELWE